MRKHPSLTLHSSTFYSILVIGFIYTLQATLPVYIGSSFLGQYMNEDNVGLVYTFGAVLTIVGFLSINRILAFLGNRLTTLWLTALQILIFAGILMTNSPLG